MQGIIVFVLLNKGTKSEGFFPFLYEGKGNFTQLFLKGEINVKNAFLSFDGKRVEITGERKDKDVLIVDTIKEL